MILIKRWGNSFFNALNGDIKTAVCPPPVQDNSLPNRVKLRKNTILKSGSSVPIYSWNLWMMLNELIMSLDKIFQVLMAM